MSNYLIKQGKHSASGLHFGVHFGITEQKYKVRFSKECLYQPLDWENDYNKLCGWSYGMHHNNSIRVCWRPFVFANALHTKSSLIELCIYVYENGVRKISEFTQLVETEEDIEFSIIYDLVANKVTLEGIGGHFFKAFVDYNIKPTCGYRLYPFFGGNKPSPQNINIKLERL